MLDPHLECFYLVGGTALALYIGHRISIDIDLFTPKPFDAPQMEAYLIDKYGFLTDFMLKNTLKGGIDEVKIDMITHAYPMLHHHIAEEGIRLYSQEDIAAMKLSAIADSGTKKYPNSNPIRALKGLGYHNDILFDEKMMLLIGNYSWNTIRQRLTEMARFPSKVFAAYPSL